MFAGNEVLRSASNVVAQAVHVKIHESALDRVAGQLGQDLTRILTTAAGGFDTDLHFVDGGPLTVQYLLVVDALNFCFWPDGELEYEHLAGGIKASLLEDVHVLDAQRLATIDGPGVQRLLRWPRPLPQQQERARLLQEVGAALLASFGGSAANLVLAAQQSALTLMRLLAQQLAGFRDQAVYKGAQVFFYKRSQIFVADVYGAFGGRGLGTFHDIEHLTMFADYRVPAVLRRLGVLRYTPELAAKVDSLQELPAGGEEEVEIRAATIMAVEHLRSRLLASQQAAGKRPAVEARDSSSGSEAVPQGQHQLLSVHLDWWLWAEGECTRAQDIHHRTLTIFY